MKRWLVILLVALAVLVLVSPGLIGEFAERNLEKGISLAANEGGRATVTTESFDKGWFTSEGVYRIVFEEGELRAAASAESPTLPSLLIKTQIRHGLIPIGDITPGWASATSTAQIDDGMGKIVDLPGTLYTQIGLTGESHFHYVAEKGSFEFAPGEVLAWDGADITLVANADMTRVSVDGKISPLQIVGKSGGLNIGTMTVKGEQSKTDIGLDVGHGSFEMESLWASGVDGETALRGLHFDTIAALDNDGARFVFNSRVDDLDIPGTQDIAYDVEVVLGRLDPEKLATIITSLRSMQGAAPGQSPADLYPGAEQDLLQLLTAGAEIGVNRFNVKLPAGDVAMTMNVAIEPSPTSTGGSWIGLLMAVDAATKITLPASLVSVAQAMSPEINGLIAMGLLLPDGDNYRMEARFNKGLLTVNGAPLPLPMPTQ